MLISKILSKRKKLGSTQKKQLKIENSRNQISIKGQLNQQITTSELWLIDKESKEGILINSIKPASNFIYKVDLEEIARELETRYDIEEKSLSWYIKVKKPLSLFSEKNIEKNKMTINFTSAEDGTEYGEYLMQLGRFSETYIDGVEYVSNSFSKITNYITAKGNVSLLFNKDLSLPANLQLEKFKVKDSNIKLEGRLFTKSLKIVSGEMLLVSRDESSHSVSFGVDFTYLENDTARKYGLNRYTYKTLVNLKSVNNELLLTNSVYDIYLDLKLENNYQKRIRLGRPTIKTKLLTKGTMIANDSTGQVVYPYYTFKSSNLSLEITNFPKENYTYLKKKMRGAWLLKLLNVKRDIWLVGERSYKAQDTGYYFFKYMRETHPKKEVYYVIDKDSPEKRNVDPLGNVITFGSKEHILLSILSKKVISSHHPDYLYPIRTKRFKRIVTAKKIFLQHGVMGTKNMIANYGKITSDFETDLFLVSSEYEKEIIVQDFDYYADEVLITGLSRFDSLMTNDVQKKRQILVIPTWRDWLVSPDQFYGSEYYERFTSLMNNKRFLDLAENNGFKIVFCLHPNMQQFTNLFSHPVIKVVKQGEIDVQQLIKESSLMITDYSSVAFDFSFLAKPIIYYQFDRNRFIGKRPSHLDLHEDLPGDIVIEEQSLIDSLEKYISNNLTVEDEYVKRSRKFLKYKDLQSNARIYDAIIDQSNYSVKPLNKIVNHYITRGVFNRFRRSSYYFPLMKNMYKLMKIIIKPDQKVILLESGLGKQYADSPKYIYEKLIEMYPNEYKFIWAYNNKNIRFNYNHTTRVKRLSPSYYYYLCKAGIWINNQNFPTYIKKPDKTQFLQTWHGTPLKRMLHDIEEIQGRSEDYLDRVSGAIKNWDYLISPSDYATKSFRSAFNYKKEIWEVGYPRNDLFYASDREEQVRNIRGKLSIPSNKKIILYTPTFRDNQKNGNNFSFELNMDLEKMQEELGEEYILLLRMHVVVSNKLKVADSLKNFVYDVSTYPEAQELLLIADILITDYSSVMFDFCNTKRPVLFYTYDLEEYRDKLRGFYFDFVEKAPGPFLYNTNQLIESVKQIESIKEKYQEKYDEFYKRFCYLEDGKAAERVVKNITSRG
ncbi:CDP-glycerol glycerophosphotransferase family protein [Virgibacillus flavescens]|uniref:CDP-glycerol glycerophosphotransferase family protein n=1 Tax=Virgibacillus flavescens TaxID=1611422 RepID=UPI003D3553C5